MCKHNRLNCNSGKLPPPSTIITTTYHHQTSSSFNDDNDNNNDEYDDHSDLTWPSTRDDNSSSDQVVFVNNGGINNDHCDYTDMHHLLADDDLYLHYHGMDIENNPCPTSNIMNKYYDEQQPEGATTAEEVVKLKLQIIKQQKMIDMLSLQLDRCRSLAMVNDDDDLILLGNTKLVGEEGESDQRRQREKKKKKNGGISHNIPWSTPKVRNLFSTKRLNLRRRQQQQHPHDDEQKSQSIPTSTTTNTSTVPTAAMLVDAYTTPITMIQSQPQQIIQTLQLQNIRLSTTLQNTRKMFVSYIQGSQRRKHNDNKRYELLKYKYDRLKKNWYHCSF